MILKCEQINNVGQKLGHLAIFTFQNMEKSVPQLGKISC